jgi:hypothetical protein
MGLVHVLRTIDDPSFLMNWTVPSFIIPVDAYSGSIFLHAIHLTIVIGIICTTNYQDSY